MAAANNERGARVREALFSQVSDLIYERMSSLKMSQRGLTRALGIKGHMTANRMLRGSNMTLATLSNVADCFGCKVRISFEEQDQ